jgi:hypothetical protein
MKNRDARRPDKNTEGYDGKNKSFIENFSLRSDVVGNDAGL